MIKLNPITGKFDLTANIKNGTATGQMAFWDDTLKKWTYTETSEMFWDDVSKRVGIGTTTPNQQLEITENFRLPDTSTTGFGIIYKGVSAFIHNFKHPTGGTAIPEGRNVFIGKSVGNLTMGSGATSTAHGSFNIGLGEVALDKLTTGYYNVAIGQYVLTAGTTANQNVGIGQYTLQKLTTGSKNIAIGYLAGRDLTTHTDNVIIGRGAMTSALGSLNVAIGTSALNVATTGNHVAIGSNALNALTTGERWIALGNYAGSANTTGSYGVAIGDNALTANTEGDNNVGIGYRALFANTTGRYNTGIGGETLYAITTQQYNVAIGQRSGYNFIANAGLFIGYNAGYNLTDETASIAIGYAALAGKTAGSVQSNTAIGYEAGRYLTNTAGNEGCYNVYLGYQAGKGASGLNKGLFNVGIGLQALTAVTTGSRNIGIGYRALAATTTGAYNTAMGYNALSSNTTGGDNFALGYQVLTDNISGIGNIGIGRDVMQQKESGNYNISIGWQSMFLNVSGAENVAIGKECLIYSTSSYNTSIGTNSGFALTSGASNIFLGYKSGYRQTTNSNLLIVDNQLRADAATEATNAILYGVMASTPASQTLRINAKLGINIDPTAHLTLPAGTATANTAPLKFTAGVLNTTAEIGAVEFVDDGTDGHLYITLNIGGTLTRKEIAFV